MFPCTDACLHTALPTLPHSITLIHSKARLLRERERQRERDVIAWLSAVSISVDIYNNTHQSSLGTVLSLD